VRIVPEPEQDAFLRGLEIEGLDASPARQHLVRVPEPVVPQVEALQAGRGEVVLDRCHIHWRAGVSLVVDRVPGGSAANLPGGHRRELVDFRGFAAETEPEGETGKRLTVEIQGLRRQDPVEIVAPLPAQGREGEVVAVLVHHLAVHFRATDGLGFQDDGVTAPDQAAELEFLVVDGVGRREIRAHRAGAGAHGDTVDPDLPEPEQPASLDEQLDRYGGPDFYSGSGGRFLGASGSGHGGILTWNWVDG
jgi:hypothetical protein